MAYIVSEGDAALIAAWKRLAGRRPALLVCAGFPGCGEDSLAEELAAAVYESGGWRDSPGRHVLYDVFPALGSSADWDAFDDAPFEVSEIYDGFPGLHVVDLGPLLSSRGPQAPAAWERLSRHVSDHAGATDFVFLAAGCPQGEGELARALARACGVAVVPVHLEPPGAGELAGAFLDEWGERPGVDARAVASAFARRLEWGSVGLPQARAAAAGAMLRAAAGAPAPECVEAAIAQAGFPVAGRRAR